MNNSYSRREILVGGSKALIAGACLPGALSSMSPLATKPALPYRAVVFLNLDGGNDSFNMVVPRGAAYPAYATARGALAIPQVQLQPLPSGCGLHPNLAPIASRSGRLAVIANCGPLVAPMNKLQYQASAVPAPRQLFSHSDQSRLWQSPSANAAFNSPGWGSLMASAVASQNAIPALTAVSFAGQTKMVSGAYSMAPTGPAGLYGTWGGAGARRRATLDALINLSPANALAAPIAQKMRQAIDIATQVSGVFSNSPSFMFPSTLLGEQMRGVARMIWCRTGLGMQRQVFFVRHGGYDTHEDAGRVRHDGLMLQLGQALAAFDDAMTAMGVNVTVCVYSEFGRTLRGNGHGSDHGWGGHQLLFGKPVRGGLYGTMPNLTMGGPDDVGLGRILPTTSHEQLGATLGQWLGAPTTIFPNLGNFSVSNLGCL
jgi:uncharacterized protein (DUF1501 family)